MKRTSAGSLSILAAIKRAGANRGLFEVSKKDLQRLERQARRLPRLRVVPVSR